MELVLQTSMKVREIKERRLALGNGSYSLNIWGAKVESDYDVLSVVVEES